jgi:hypothetical protein
MAEISHNKICDNAAFAGPKIGPLLYVQRHYAQKLVLRFTNQRNTKRFFPEATLPLGSLDVIEGTLVYGDKCNGDWDVCYVAAKFRKLSKPVSTAKSPSSPSDQMTVKPMV